MAEVTCGACNGSGRDECVCVHGEDDCPACGGSGMMDCTYCDGTGVQEEDDD